MEVLKGPRRLQKLRCPGRVLRRRRRWAAGRLPWSLVSGDLPFALS